MRKNDGRVLRSHIIALRVQSRRVMETEEELAQFLVAALATVIHHVAHFGVAGLSRADSVI